MTAEHAEQMSAPRTTPLHVPPPLGPAAESITLPATTSVHTLAPTGLWVRVLKRGFDVVVASVLLFAVLPIVLTVALAVRLGLGSPVLFRQQRLGRNGKPFFVLKFRTMDRDRRRRMAAATWDGEDRRRTHKTDHDPRHTGVGRFLRRTSLDELPQLWNVVRGDMSLVGPRPELVEVAARYAPWQHGRHVVRPGITGLWQITARGDTPMHEATHIDLEYVAALSWRTDLSILLRTPLAVLRRSGG